MGCFGSKEVPAETLRASKRASSVEETWDGTIRKLKPWKHTPPVSKQEVMRMREEFWDTQPHYGGSREIWMALKASIDMDEETRALVLQSADIIIGAPYTMAVCFDTRGYNYVLPNYVIGFPSNLLPDGAKATASPEKLAANRMASNMHARAVYV